jgi:hypothetical protein
MDAGSATACSAGMEDDLFVIIIIITIILTL